MVLELLRSDVHRLFDAGYITVQKRVRVSAEERISRPHRPPELPRRVGATRHSELAAKIVLGEDDASRRHTCGVTTDRAAYCWGYNGSGQLGDGTTTNRGTPTLVTGPSG